DDHANARRLAEGLREIPGIELDPPEPRTNMVYFNLAPAIGLTTADVMARMTPRGILLDPEDQRRFRLVTHYWVTAADVENVIGAFRESLSA
ncbi:MAG: threonine aldolase, partial [Bryobacteraceae bacterium]